MNKLKFISLTAALVLATAFTFSCSDSGGGGGDDGGSSSSVVGGSSSSVVGDGSSSSGGGGTAPTITTTTLAGGTVGTPYSQTLTATGDTPITWTLDNGTLPTGLDISGNTITGTPTVANTFNFKVKATNATGSVTKDLSIVIANPDGVTATYLKFTEVQVYSDNMTALTGSTFAGAYPDYYRIRNNFTPASGPLADDFTSPVCTIANGKLTLNLGVPKAEAILTDVGFGAAASDNTAKFLAISDFLTDDVALSLVKDNLGDNKTVLFLYVDKPVTLNGPVGTHTFSNFSLTTGWNMILRVRSGSSYTCTKVTTLDSTYKWVATDDL